LTPEHARPGMRVRVMEHHRVQEGRGLVGTVVAPYGREEYIAVRLADGQSKLFWPRDLEEIYPSSPEAWWRFLLGWGSAGQLRPSIHASA
jgi:hypothetical protein